MNQFLHGKFTDLVILGPGEIAHGNDFGRHMSWRRAVADMGVDKTTGLRCDQTIRLAGKIAAEDYPQPLRRVVFYDKKNDKRLVF